MNFLQASLLGILQGITEFLPISSSGHLVLFEHFLNIQLDENILKGFDVILHFGTLLAILIYFKKDLLQIFKGIKLAIKNKKCNQNTQTFHNIILATLPVLAVGFFFNDFIDQTFRDTKMVAIMLALTGLILILSEKFPQKKERKSLNLNNALIIGLFQVFALIPGISRSGTTISVAMFQGFSREAAARFSFLLAIPAISAAVCYVCLQAFLGKVIFPEISILIVGFFTSFISSYLCVTFLMQFIRKHSLSVFSWYLFIVSGALLI